MRFLLAIIAIALWCSHAAATNVSATSWIVADANGKPLRSHNPGDIKPIASITKLVTAMVILDSGADLDEPLEISREVDSSLPSEIDLMSRRQMLAASLIRSDNMSSMNLCKWYPWGYDACIKAMNQKVRDLGMTDTKLYDSWGLDPRNVSTANDLVLLVAAAARYQLILDMSSRSDISFLLDGKTITLRNTNPLAGRDRTIMLSKTGYTRRAGACIVMLLRTERGPRIVVFLHGSSVRKRASEAKTLILR